MWQFSTWKNDIKHLSIFKTRFYLLYLKTRTNMILPQLELQNHKLRISLRESFWFFFSEDSILRRHLKKEIKKVLCITIQSNHYKNKLRHSNKLKIRDLRSWKPPGDRILRNFQWNWGHLKIFTSIWKFWFFIRL